MTKPDRLESLYFSQHALDLYRLCPLRFRRRYLEGLYWSKLWSAPAPEREAVEKGELFHLLAQRYFSGLPCQLAPGHPWAPDLNAWVAELQRFCPAGLPGHAYYPELEVRLAQDQLRLLAKFDLLVVAPDGTATLYDWKTERRLPRPSYLKDSLQTLVYRYLLCAAAGAYSPRGAFAPEAVTLVYWNPQYPREPVRLPYSLARHEADEGNLRLRIGAILATPYPEGFAATTNEKTCRTCEYRPLCHGRKWETGDPEADEALAEELDWSVPEIPL